MKRRPTAEDREIADYVRKLPVGRHLVEVTPEGYANKIQFLPQAKLKVEGGMYLQLPDRLINFMPGMGGKP